MRWVCGALVLSLALSACATRQTIPPQTLNPDQQRSLLQDLPVFSFSGRVKITGQEAMPSVRWEQQRETTKVGLGGPIAGGLQFEYTPGHLRLVTSRGKKLAGDEAEAELINAMGFVPPFDSLRYWILGVPAPGAAPMATFDADGLVLQLQQQDWTISYQGRGAVKTSAGVLQLPAKLVATHGTLKLTLVIDSWRIK